MDAYNRGYGHGIVGLEPFGQLGKATITNDSFVLGGTITDRLDAQVDFYAIAYDVSQAGIEDVPGTVVSYHGTNLKLDLFDLSSLIWNDMRNGWTVGTGIGAQQAPWHSTSSKR